MKIIIGLGNPGNQYERTRHNAGWIFLDNLIGADGWQTNKKFNALTKEAAGLIFVKPLTFMNESGQSVQKVLNYYGLIPKKLGVFSKKNEDLNYCLTVIQDDLDLDIGVCKIATDSGSAGHRGIASIIQYLKTQKFKRLRLGIKNELLRTHIPAEKFVLQPFGREELEKIKNIADQYTAADL
ncbi:MAG: aminoacyl-tRNA hydrolase [Candidatus Falkowbacteria bacterium]|nr:MAG: aminoacyl-tRNA hydrolase [Candidatus Falkowbacteria bacterium]